MTNGGLKYGIVIPAAENRIKNLDEVLKRLFSAHEIPDQIIVICDGWENEIIVTERYSNYRDKLKFITINKYEPDGTHDQPRNVGVRALNDDIDMVWFLDSDVIPGEYTLANYQNALHSNPGKKIQIGPYDWLPEGRRYPDRSLFNDPRWGMFNEFGKDYTSVGELNYALACFSGNLVWPVDEFKRIGGFWNEINMGRCEDGELGLRAASFEIPMQCVPAARGWHLWHPVNLDWVHKANERDVPKLNERHPWVQEKGLVVAEKDGARFDIVCQTCGEQINTLEIWSHKCQNS